MSKKTERLTSLSIDVLVPDVGRIQKRIGTDSVKRRDDYLAMIRALQRDGRLEILRNLREGIVSFALVYEAWNSGKLNTLPSAETLLPLHETWDAWVRDLETAPVKGRLSKEHIRAHKYGLLRLLKVMRAHPSLTELPDALETLKKSYRQMPGTYNKTLNSARAFLRDTLKKRHPLYQQLRAESVLTYVRARDPKQLLVTELVELEKSEKLPADVMQVVWSLATTGMIPKEYWVDGFRFGMHHLHIDGQKRRARDRDIPDLGRCVKPPCTYEKATRAVLYALDGMFQLKDLRNTFAFWMEECGIPRTRRKMYLGHGMRDVTDLYERQEVAQFLREDGDKLKAYMVAQGAVEQGTRTENPNILTLEKHG